MAKCCEEVTTANFYVSFLFEGLATALLMFIGGTVFLRINLTKIGLVSSEHVVETGLVFGVTLAGLTYCLKDISGAHINPAITIAAMLTRRVSLLRGIFYVIFQFGGGILGAFTLCEFIPNAMGKGLAMTNLTREVSLVRGIGFEIIFTFVYAWIHFSSKGRYEVFKGFAGPLAIGFFYGVSHIVLIEYTGCSLNPARSFGPALLLRKWDDLWIYFAGLILSSCLAGLLNDLVFSRARLNIYPRPRSCSLTCCKPTREEASLREFRHDDIREVIIKKAEEDA